MITEIQYKTATLQVNQLKTYFFATLFVAGNILLPQLCHLFPEGGKMFLPIYFFTLIGAYRYGWIVGLLTALASPLLNHVFFEMPPLQAMPVLLIKSSLLVLTASVIVKRTKSLSIFQLVVIVAIYQLIGSCIEWILSGSIHVAEQDLVIGWPGILLQVIAGYFVLRLIRRHDDPLHG